MLIDDHISDSAQVGRRCKDPQRYRLYFAQGRQRVEAADIALGIQRLATRGEGHPDQLACLGQQFTLTARVGDQLTQQCGVHARPDQSTDHLGIARFQHVGDGIEAGNGAVPGLGLGLVP